MTTGNESNSSGVSVIRPAALDDRTSGGYEQHPLSRRELRPRRNLFLLSFVVLVTFLWSSGFNLRIFQASGTVWILQIPGMLLILFAAVFSAVLGKIRHIGSVFYFRAIILILFAVLFPTIINLVFVNGMNLAEVFRAAVLYPGFFIFIVLYSWRTDANFVSRLNFIIFVICSVNVLFLVILANYISMTDSLIATSGERFGTTRLTLADGIGPMCLYSLFFAVAMATKGVTTRKKRMVYGLLSGLFLWFYITVDMGRRNILVIIIVMGLYWMFNLSGIRKFQSLLAVVVFVIVALAVSGDEMVEFRKIKYNIYSAYSSSVEEYESKEGNVQVRVDGMKYYMKYFKETAFIGFGLLSNRLPANNPIMRGRVLYRYNPNDHGIVAVIYRYGLPGLVVTIVILVRMFKDLTVIIRRGSRMHRAIATGIQLYLIASIVGLLQIIWKESMCVWTGMMFFMVWRMRKEIPNGVRKPRRNVLRREKPTVRGTLPELEK